jgi:hypothetical protein
VALTCVLKSLRRIAYALGLALAHAMLAVTFSSFSVSAQAETVATLHRGTFEGTPKGITTAELAPGALIDVKWISQNRDGSEKIVRLLTQLAVVTTSSGATPGKIAVTVDIARNDIVMLSFAQATGELLYTPSDPR